MDRDRTKRGKDNPQTTKPKDKPRIDPGLSKLLDEVEKQVREEKKRR